MNYRSFSSNQTVSASQAHIRILATSDIHMNLTGYDYYADRPDLNIGFTRTASLIRAARSQVREKNALVLLFDNGDSMQGSPFGEWAAKNTDLEHPLAQAFNALRYDAIGLGNHDFGFGLETVQRFVAQTRCPVVCSNMHLRDANAGWVPHVVLERTIATSDGSARIKIGVLSVLPPQTVRWEAHMLGDMAEVSDIVGTARETASELRQKGCDLVVALAHSGLEQGEAKPGMENAVIPLAEIADIDAIIAGHSHLTLPGRDHGDLENVDNNKGLVHGKPVVMQGWAGSHLGIIDLTVARDRQDRWTVCNHQTELRSVAPPNRTGASTPEDSELVGLFARGHDETRAHAAKPVGHVPRSLHSFFTYCAPDRSLALLASAQAAALRIHLSDTTYANLPVLSAVAPAKFGGRAGPAYYTDVQAGDISMRHVADIHVFPNELRAILISGQDLREWLEMSAGLFNQLTAKTGSELVNPHRTGHNFDVMFGVSYRIDLSQPARYDASGIMSDPAHSRIRNLTFEDRPVEPNDTFVVALNNYRANGGGQFPIASAQAQFINLPSLRVHDILCEYLAGRLAADPLENAPRPFSFTSFDARSVILKTGPAARKYLCELKEYKPEVLGTDSDGFLLVQLTL